MKLERVPATDDGSTETRSDPEPEEDAPTPSAASLPKDIIFGLLSAKRRRDVLSFLDANGGESTLSDVAEHIAALENGIEPHELTSQQRKRVYIGLYQCHLPKMDDADVIDFNKARGDIELRPNADELFRYLDESPSGTPLAEAATRSPESSLWKSMREKLSNLQ
jgi:hypothetical protein